MYSEKKKSCSATTNSILGCNLSFLLLVTGS